MGLQNDNSFLKCAGEESKPHSLTFTILNTAALCIAVQSQLYRFALKYSFEEFFFFFSPFPQ